MTPGISIHVVGDVHANAPALRAALAASADADAVVLLGDLLTYGTEVDPVLDLVLEAQARRAAVVVRGNHDRIYDELLAGVRSSYVDALPAWIRESIDSTLAGLDPVRWGAVRFVDEHSIAGVLFGHAGPWPRGDDTYLSATREFVAARERLRERGIACGVFGHSHRPRLFAAGDTEPRVPPLFWAGPLDAATPVVLNAGAVGQPRDRDRSAWSVRLGIEPTSLRATFERLTYDRDAHLDALRRSGLSAPTLERLLAFHGDP